MYSNFYGDTVRKMLYRKTENNSAIS
uniref:Uncharacterized protein n=1 Tax=Anguilla anguilla TaxID=7936 RepID=A0A0E9V5M8_ANGAN